ncbi:MAG: FCD domain-containing protein [Blautia sp.]
MQKKFIEKHNPTDSSSWTALSRDVVPDVPQEKCYRVVQGLSGHFDRVRNLSISIMENAKIYEEHRELVNALREGRSTDAVNLVQTHLTNYRKEKKELLKRFPEYFAPGQEESPGDSTQKI